jgi:hypothetical protein
MLMGTAIFVFGFLAGAMVTIAIGYVASSILEPPIDRSR